MVRLIDSIGEKVNSKTFSQKLYKQMFDPV